MKIFRASTSCSKILNEKKKYIQCSEFRAHSVFQGKCKLLKNPENKKHIQYSEKFQGKLCSSKQALSCSKILNGKKYIQNSEEF